MRVWYQLVDNRNTHEFTVQQVFPRYTGVKSGEFCVLPLLASRSEADEAVKACNKAAGGEFFSHRRVRVVPAE